MNNRIVEDAIEVHAPDGIRMIAMPAECSVARVGAMVLQLMDCAGYESIKPERGGAFAFAPRVEADEVRDTPFDSPPATLCERLSMIACTRAGPMTQDGGQIRGRLYDYESGCPWEIRADRVQPDLQAVREE